MQQCLHCSVVFVCYNTKMKHVIHSQLHNMADSQENTLNNQISRITIHLCFWGFILERARPCEWLVHKKACGMNKNCAFKCY